MPCLIHASVRYFALPASFLNECLFVGRDKSVIALYRIRFFIFFLQKQVVASAIYLEFKLGRIHVSEGADPRRDFARDETS